jgi:hypothetical protein
MSRQILVELLNTRFVEICSAVLECRHTRIYRVILVSSRGCERFPITETKLSSITLYNLQRKAHVMDIPGWYELNTKRRNESASLE